MSKFNKVFATASSLLFEMDETPDNFRGETPYDVAVNVARYLATNLPNSLPNTSDYRKIVKGDDETHSFYFDFFTPDEGKQRTYRFRIYKDFSSDLIEDPNGPRPQPSGLECDAIDSSDLPKAIFAFVTKEDELKNSLPVELAGSKSALPGMEDAETVNSLPA